jgi:hypothetical protein
MSRKLKTVFLLCIFEMLLSCSDGFPPEFPAADFTLKSPLTGKEVKFSEIKGNPIIIYWFASW